MPQLFAVIRTRGTAWQPSLPLEAQRDWRPHADFMKALHRDGFVLLGGPLEESDEVLLIIGANDAEEIRRRLAADSWSDDLLQIARIQPWTLRLGTLA